jgi:hypothetical protein
MTSDLGGQSSLTSSRVFSILLPKEGGVMRSVLAVILLSSLITGSGFAANPKNVISLQPITALGFANVEYERALAPKVSCAVRMDVLYRRGQVEEDDDGEEYKLDLNGFGGGGSLRFYPLGSAPKRAYGGVDIDIVHASGERVETGETGSGTVFTVGAVIGWKWLISDAFAIALDFGSMYATGSFDIEGTESEEEAGFAGLLPTGHLYLGLAF